jgi:hypothetical protein
MLNPRSVLIAPLVVIAVIAAGCGGSSSSTTATTSTPAASAPATSTAGSAGALSAEATSAATGDIPDTQMFLTYTSAAGRYSMSYPEGWTQLAAGPDVTIKDKNNLVRVSIHNGAPPTLAAVTAEIGRLKAATPSLTSAAPSPIQLKSGPAIKVTYQTQSAPNPVTNKRVLLIVDRYELAHNGKVATVDLGTPQGVDNVDAYKMIINSFKWR